MHFTLLSDHVGSLNLTVEQIKTPRQCEKLPSAHKALRRRTRRRRRRRKRRRRRNSGIRIAETVTSGVNPINL